jgi:pseudouridine-5'-phosphate glycosidase
VGLDANQLRKLAELEADKASLWNLAALCARNANAGTTVATTLYAAQQAGIKVFATGGIGGVHHEAYDESADLQALARYRLVVVCAGAKSILNVAATYERLESLGVPVIGYQSDVLAGFHTPLTDLTVPTRADSPHEVATCFASQTTLGLPHALLVSQPVNEGIDAATMHAWLTQAHEDAFAHKLSGKAVTPFLLARLAELSDGQTVSVNRRLLVNNARLAAQIATEIDAVETATDVLSIGKSSADKPSADKPSANKSSTDEPMYDAATSVSSDSYISKTNLQRRS